METRSSKTGSLKTGSLGTRNSETRSSEIKSPEIKGLQEQKTSAKNQSRRETVKLLREKVESK